MPNLPCLIVSHFVLCYALQVYLLYFLFRQLELTPKEQDQKRKLIEAAFGDWSRKDFRAFVAATERHGRDDTEAVLRDVCLETAKPEENVRKYIKVSVGLRSSWLDVCSVRWVVLVYAEGVE